MQKPINLMSIRFSDINGRQVVREEYNTIFRTHELAELFIEERREYWQKLFDMKLKIDPYRNETIEEIEIQKLFKLTAKAMNIDPKFVLRRTRDADIIEVRRISIAICGEFGLSPSNIGRAINMNHTTIIHHRKRFFDLCRLEPGYEDRYNEIRDNVLNKLNGKFMDDGSGKEKKDGKS